MEPFLNQILSNWMPGFMSILELRLDSNNLAVKCQVIEVLGRAFKSFPKETNNMAREVFILIWAELLRVQVDYLNQYVYAKGIDHADVSIVNADGDSQSLETLVSVALEFVQIAMRRKQVKLLMKNDINNSIGVLTGYLQLSIETEHSWESDVNQLVLDDDEDSMTHSIRIVGRLCLSSFVDTIGEEAVSTLFFTCTNMFQLASSRKHQGDQYWWKIAEASLLCFGKFAPELQQLAKKGILNLDPVFETVLQEFLQCNCI